MLGPLLAQTALNASRAVMSSTGVSWLRVREGKRENGKGMEMLSPVREVGWGPW